MNLALTPRSAYAAAQLLGSPAGRAFLAAGKYGASKLVAKGIGKLAKTARTLSFNTPRKSTLKEVKKKKYGSSTGKHAGFIRGYRRMGRTARRRYRKALAGVQFNYEQVNQVTDNRCVYIGHYSMPPLTIAKYSVYALVKAIMNHADIQFSSFDEAFLGSLAAGDIVGIEYRLSPLLAPTAVSYTIAAGETTYRNVADGLWTVMYNTFLVPPSGPVGYGSQSTLLKAYLNRAGQNREAIILSDASIGLICKSSLKMQNRSINTVDDDEASDVNNVPLVGKSYQFKGNIMVPRDTTLSNAVTGAMNPPDNQTGIIRYGAGSSDVIAEPPEAYFYANKPKVVKLRFQPGVIKTSTINDNITMNLSNFWRYLNGLFRIGPPQDRVFCSLGKSRLFALERSIGRLAAEVEPGIVLTTEVDNKFWINIYIGSGKWTAPTNVVV